MKSETPLKHKPDSRNAAAPASRLASRVDFLMLRLTLPIIAALTVAALAAPAAEARIWPIGFGLAAVSLIFFDFLESVWSYSQPHASGRRKVLGARLIASMRRSTSTSACTTRSIG